MKYIRITLRSCVLVIMLLCILSLKAIAASTAEPYLTERDYADFSVLFQPPGEDDPLFLNDLAWHYRARELWGTPRAEEARLDCPWDIGVAKRFEEAFGQVISLETTPELYVLLERTAMDVSIALRPIKQRVHRVRPYVYFGENTLIPDDEDALRLNGSYPSGHSCVGFAFALILAEIAPEHQVEILMKGLDYGKSRVIANYHWASDVEAARLIAAMIVARLHNCGDFRNQLDRARHEHRAMATSSSP